MLQYVPAKTLILEQTVILLRRRSDVRCYQNSNDESIYRDDTGHNDRDERLLMPDVLA
jgi:hypothetical protein